VVVDTNVPIVANRVGGVSAACVVACAHAVTSVMNDESCLAIDVQRLIINEYMANLRQAGQPGLGDRFLKWVLTNQANSERCHRVEIHPHGDREFEEFPDRSDLAAFDRADRKFVAVALAHPRRPPILEAVDSDWWGAREALAAAGVRVEFLCEEEVRTTWEAKAGGGRGRRGG